MGSVVKSEAEGGMTVPTTDLTPPVAAMAFLTSIICLCVGAMVDEKKIEGLTKKEIRALDRNQHVTHTSNK